MRIVVGWCDVPANVPSEIYTKSKLENRNRNLLIFAELSCSRINWNTLIASLVSHHHRHGKEFVEFHTSGNLSQLLNSQQ